MLAESLLRVVLIFLLKYVFRLDVKGFEHYYRAGDRVLIICNHISYLDPLILAVFLPEKPAFAINVFQADKWYFRWLDKIVTLYKLDPSKPLSMKNLIADLRKGKKVVIFPEGRISTSGGIMKIYDGTSLVAEKTGAAILPVRVDGAEYSKVSRVGKKLRQRWFPKVRMTVLPPVPHNPAQPITSQQIYDLMTHNAFTTHTHHETLLAAILRAYEWHGGKNVVATDIARIDMNYGQLFTRAFVLSEKLKPRLEGQTYVGMMLPNSNGAIVTFLALQMLGKIPCMLNYSAGVASIRHACDIALVKTVLTSRAFVEKGKLEGIIGGLQDGHTLLWLEDIRATVTTADKLTGAIRSRIARGSLAGVLASTNPDDPCVVIYTSGSEGTPKGVALSHGNLLANINQICARLDLMPSDKFFNAMPIFHSFGLSIGTLLPLVKGSSTFMYPSPLHFRVVPDMVYDTDATIMLGTDTFYNGYAHYAHSVDFWNIRIAVAGAEKLKEHTRRLYADKFRLNIMEGYGVSEASPVISVNTPLENRVGSVGRALPAIECRMEKVPGLESGGRLFVKGPNIMLGYLKADKPGVIQPQGEWYDTGDIVDTDEDGYLSIQGRAKRFAKIAGEMVSLLAVEDLAASLLPDVAHAAIAVPDERRGEQVILFTESPSLTRDQLVQHARQVGCAEICLPKQLIILETIPRLGNGKIDYVTLSGTQLS